MSAHHDRGRVAVAVVLLGLMALWLWSLQQDRDQFADRVTDLEQDRNEFAGSLAEANGQLEALGVEPRVEVEHTPDGPEPVEVRGPRGERGEPGAVGERGEPGEPGPAPSDEQVAAAVERYCETNDCTGPQGPAPTATQVAAAVANYCDARGRCQGPTGEPGDDGGPGPQGEPGPGPSDAQIAEAVETYCAPRDGCRGPAGPPGPAGETGAPGPAGEPGAPGAPGPACPEGAEPRIWAVSQAQSIVIGLEPGTYVICLAPEGSP